MIVGRLSISEKCEGFDNLLQLKPAVLFSNLLDKLSCNAGKFDECRPFKDLVHDRYDPREPILGVRGDGSICSI